MSDWKREALLHSRLPEFAEKVASARERVASFLGRVTKPYVAFSTGKDSVVVAALVHDRDPAVPLVYFDADCAYPESAECLQWYAERYPTIVWKCEPFFETLRRVGGPTAPECEEETMRSTVYRPAAALKTKYGFDGVFLGLRAEESAGRNTLLETPSYWRKRDQMWNCNPIIDWTSRDVWAYILSKNLHYCAVYDRLREIGVPEKQCRLSYWAGETCQSLGRWAVLRRGWPELFNRFAAEFPEVRGYV